MLEIAFSTLAGGVVLLAGYGWFLVHTGAAISRLEVPSVAMAAPGRRSRLAPFFDRAGAWLGPPAMRFVGRHRALELRRRLVAAGGRGGTAVTQFVGRKATFAALFGTLGVAFTAEGSWWVLPVALLAGWFWMDLWLLVVQRGRQDQIQRGLPDFLDVVAVTVGAGLGFRASLARVAESQPGPISEEIMTALHQMDLGVSRRSALEQLRERNRSPILSQFVTALLQAEELGAPLSATLVELAGDMRREAAQEARRHAARAAPRISLVVALFIVPGSIILMVVGMILGSNFHLRNFVGH